MQLHYHCHINCKLNCVTKPNILKITLALRAILKSNFPQFPRISPARRAEKFPCKREIKSARLSEPARVPRLTRLHINTQQKYLLCSNLYTKGFPSIGYSSTRKPFLYVKIISLSQSCKTN